MFYCQLSMDFYNAVWYNIARYLADVLYREVLYESNNEEIFGYYFYFLVSVFDLLSWQK